MGSAVITVLLLQVLSYAEMMWCQSGNSAKSQAEHVRLVHNVLLSSAHGPLHSVSFTYSFPGHQSVIISGLGRMPSAGDLHYLTSDVLITFSDATGHPLETLDLKDATQPMGASSSDSLTVKDFPENFRIGFWRSPAPFADHALKVLNRRCASGLLPTATSSQDEYFLITT